MALMEMELVLVKPTSMVQTVIRAVTVMAKNVLMVHPVMVHVFVILATGEPTVVVRVQRAKMVVLVMMVLMEMEVANVYLVTTAPYVMEYVLNVLMVNAMKDPQVLVTVFAL
jgi:hypothetical protein